MLKEKNKEIFINNLKRYMSANSLNQNDIASITKKSKQAVSDWFNFKSFPNVGTIQDLADYFNINFSNLIEESNAKKTNLISCITVTKIPIKILGTASCGDGYNNDHDILEYIEVPNEWIKGSNVFGCYSTGDSMLGAGIIEGSLIIAKEQNTLENNEIGIFHLNGDEYIKRFKNTGGVIELKSENFGYPDIEVKEEDAFRIIGKVTKIITEIN